MDHHYSFRAFPSHKSTHVQDRAIDRTNYFKLQVSQYKWWSNLHAFITLYFSWHFRDAKVLIIIIKVAFVFLSS